MAVTRPPVFTRRRRTDAQAKLKEAKDAGYSTVAEHEAAKAEAKAEARAKAKREEEAREAAARAAAAKREAAVRSRVGAVGLLKPLEDAGVATPEVLGAAAAWCENNGATHLDDIVSNDLTDEFVAALKLKTIPARKVTARRNHVIT